MRFFAPLALVVLAGCTAVATGSTEAALRGGAQQAYFPSYPEGLFFAAAATCDEPGQTVVRPSRDEVRCESLPSPQAAAGLILEHNGTVEDLPRYVFAFRGVQLGGVLPRSVTRPGWQVQLFWQSVSRRAIGRGLYRHRRHAHPRAAARRRRAPVAVARCPARGRTARDSDDRRRTPRSNEMTRRRGAATGH